METEPTNLDLQKALEGHAADDKAFQSTDALFKANINATLVRMEKAIGDLTSATADSVTATKNFKLGFSVLKVSGKSVIQIGAVVTALYGIWLVIRAIIIGIILKP